MKFNNIFYSDEDQAYIATCEEFPSLSGIGNTPEEAKEELKIAIDGTGKE